MHDNNVEQTYVYVVKDAYIIVEVSLNNIHVIVIRNKHIYEKSFPISVGHMLFYKFLIFFKVPFTQPKVRRRSYFTAQKASITQ